MKRQSMRWMQVIMAAGLVASVRGAAAEDVMVPPEELTFKGKIVVCDDMPVPPYSMFDAEGNAFGIDPDLAREMGKRLGLQVEVINVVFNTIIPALQSRKCDIIMSAMNVTAERQKVITQIPYAQTGRAFVVRKGNPTGAKTTMDLCGVKVATQTGTVGTDQITGAGDFAGKGFNQACAAAGKPDVDMQQYAKGTDVLLAVLSGQADVAFLDSGEIAAYIEEHENEIESAIGIQAPSPQGIGVTFDRPGLTKAIEATLAAIVADGTYDKIFEKYKYPEGAYLTMKK